MTFAPSPAPRFVISFNCDHADPRLTMALASRRFRMRLMDGDEPTCGGVRDALEERQEITVVGAAGSVRERVKLAERPRPDVVVTELLLSDGSSIDACRAIRRRVGSTKILLFSSLADEEALRSVVLTGASGYLLEDVDVARLQDAVVAAAMGGASFDPYFVPRLLEWLCGDVPSSLASTAVSRLSESEK